MAMVSNRPSPATSTGAAKQACMSRLRRCRAGRRQALPGAEPRKASRQRASGSDQVGSEQPSTPMPSRSSRTPQVSEMIPAIMTCSWMVRPLVAARIETEIDRGGEHAGMLARAIIVDGLRAASRLDQFARRLVAHRPMDAAGEIALIEPGLGQQAPHRRDMQIIAAMGGAGDRKLLIAEPERIGRPALDQRHGLQRLDRRAREHRPLDIAEREHEAAMSVGNGDRAGVAALDEGPSDHLDEHGIGRIGFTHA